MYSEASKKNNAISSHSNGSIIIAIIRIIKNIMLLDGGRGEWTIFADAAAGISLFFNDEWR